MNHNRPHDEARQEPISAFGDLGFEPLLDVLLRIHPKTLQRLARRGEITGIQTGKLRRFDASTLNRWLDRPQVRSSGVFVKQPEQIRKIRATKRGSR
jgi:excisionase family DNA binding protein